MSSSRWVAAAVFWAAAFAYGIHGYTLNNDHFHRISSARQIARYGELPFRDFFDPGYLLTEFASAALQRILGDNLTGELLLNTVSIATGALLVLLLALRVSRSYAIAIAAGMLALSAGPRAYDYDKFLFFPLGLLAAWRYLERPAPGTRAILGLVIAVAALFRYDHGAYLLIAALAGIAALDGLTWRSKARETAVLIGLVAIALVPAIVFVQMTAGIGDALDQVVTYARREGLRTRLTTLPPLSGVGALYYVFVLLPIVAALLLRFRRPRVEAIDRARLWTVIALCLLLDGFVLRDPVSARVGGVAGPPAVLAAAIVAMVASDWFRRASMAVVMILAVGVSVVVLPAAIRRLPDVTPARVARAIVARVESPDEVPSRIAAMVAYLRACTGPSDRILTNWYVPDVYYYARRGFAARLSVSFGGHWSEPRFQQRSIEALMSQRVPIVLLETPEDFFDSHPQIDAFLREHYEVAGETDFGDPGGDRRTVLVRSGLEPSSVHAASGLPCFAGGADR